MQIPRFAIAPLFALLAPVFLQAQAPVTAPDAGLYISFFTGVGFQNVSWVICGSTAQTEGCYDSGNLGPFGRAGAMIEGNPAVNLSTNTVTRSIYVVDIGTGSSGNGVTLYVYKRTDVITSSFDTTTITLTRTLPLPLTGGSTALCSMAANTGFLFIGTDQSASAVRVQKNNLAVTQIGGFEPPINVSGITADKYGYVTITFGGFTTGENGFVQFGPNGQGVGDGGGAWFMLNNTIGLSTTTLPPAIFQPQLHLEVRPKSSNTDTEK